MIGSFLLLMASIVPAQEPFPHLGIEALSGQIDKYADSSLVSAPLSTELKLTLNQSLLDLQRAAPSGAIQHLETFRNKLAAQIAPDIGEPLAAQAGAIEEQISNLSGRRLTAVIDSCVVPAEDEFVYLRVGPDREFETISQALAWARESDTYAVGLVLDPVAYREGVITIDRHTRFFAPRERARIVGGIRNLGPYLVELRGVIVSGSPESDAAIYADNQCAVTVLRGVEVEFASATGIRQRGGSFTGENLSVSFSTAPDYPSLAERHVGRGLHLSDGVDACITDAAIDRNDSGALLVEGFMTRVFVSRLGARNNSVNPVVVDDGVAQDAILPGAGSLEVRDQAYFLGEWIRIDAAALLGLFVDSDAQAHLRYSAVDRSEAVSLPGDQFGGHNVYVGGGTLELTTILSRHADLAGLFVNNKTGGHMTTSGTNNVSDNLAGVYLLVDDAEQASCQFECLGGLELLRNDQTIGSNIIPIPCDPLTGAGCYSCPSCSRVNYSPDWCEE